MKLQRLLCLQQLLIMEIKPQIFQDASYPEQ